jgi:hypothetical protein
MNNVEIKTDPKTELDCIFMDGKFAEYHPRHYSRWNDDGTLKLSDYNRAMGSRIMEAITEERIGLKR